MIKIKDNGEKFNDSLYIGDTCCDWNVNIWTLHVINLQIDLENIALANEKKEQRNEDINKIRTSGDSLIFNQ